MKNVLSLSVLLLLFSCETKISGEIDDVNTASDTIMVEQQSNPEIYKVIMEYKDVGKMMDSLEMIEKQGNQEAIARLKVDLAEEFRASGNYLDAIDFLEESRKTIEKHPSSSLAGEYYSVLAAVYYELFLHNKSNKHYLDSVDYYANKSGAIANTLSDDKLKAGSFNLMGVVRIHTGDYLKAKVILDRARRFDKKTINAPEVSILTNLAYAHLKLGYLDSALHYSEESLDWANKRGDVVFSATNYRILSMIYTEKGDEEMAAEMRENHAQLSAKKDVVVKSLITKQLLMNYEKQKADSKILGLYQDRFFLFRLSRLLLVGLVFAVLVGVVVAFLIVRNHQKKKKVVQQQLELERKEHAYHQAQATILVQEKKIEQERAEKYELELQKRDQELVFQSLKLANLAKINQSVKDRLLPFSVKLSRKGDQELFRKEVETICREVKRDTLSDFEQMFMQMHNEFYEKLTAINPDLTRSELQLCALLRMNLPTKEMANLLCLSPYTIVQRRHSIRKKLSLKNNANLNSYLIAL